MNYRSHIHWLFLFALCVVAVGFTPNVAWAGDFCSNSTEVTAVFSVDPNNPSDFDAFATAISGGYEAFENCGELIGVEGDLYKDGTLIDWAVDAENSEAAEATMVDPYDSGYSYTLSTTAYVCLGADLGIGNTDQGTWLQGCYPLNDGNSKTSATYP
jgi:hypothetical protein